MEGDMSNKNRLLMLGLAVAMAVSMIPSMAAQKKSIEPVKVFVFTAENEGGFTDKSQKDRADAVEDLKKALDKTDLVQVVPQKQGADITLEVLSRGREDRGTTTTTTSGGYYGV
jgi:hypothetical protein